MTIHRLDFNSFTEAIRSLNKRTDAVNATRKRKRFAKVWRFPKAVNGDAITVRIPIKDRAKVLWQELTGIMDRYRLETAS